MLVSRNISDFVERWPLAYNGLMRCRYWGKEQSAWMVRPNYDVVIEGFQRCANSFAVRAFRQAQGPEAKLRLATHIHSPAQIQLAVRWGIPTIVVIRPPDAAVVSLLAWAKQLNKLPEAAFESPNIEKLARYWTRRYAQFYERIIPLRKHFVLAPFEEITSDFGTVIDRLNAQFGTAFKRFEHTEEAQAAIFRANAVHLSPSPERDAFKKRFVGAFEDDGNAHSREWATRVWLHLTDQNFF